MYPNNSGNVTMQKYIVLKGSNLFYFIIYKVKQITSLYYLLEINVHICEYFHKISVRKNRFNNSL